MVVKCKENGVALCISVVTDVIDVMQMQSKASKASKAKQAKQTKQSTAAADVDAGHAEIFFVGVVRGMQG